MRVAAHYEVQSEASLVSDDLCLEFQHPKGQFQARIKNITRSDYSTPFRLSLQISFEAPNLDEAKDIAEDKLVECLNILAFATATGVRRHRITQIVDCTPESGMRECRVWSDSIAHEDPQPFLDEGIITSIERLLQFDLPPEVRRALRWYRLGIGASIPDEQFQFFWFALEILAEYQKSPNEVPDKCPDCKSPLYCETCRKNPTHRPYAKQAIRDLIQAVEPTCDEETLTALDDARNALMHGRTLREVERKLPKSDEHLVDVLGKILFKALLYQFPREILEPEIKLGIPSTYRRRTIGGIAHVSTIVPRGDDGELDLSKTSLKVSMVVDGPPQSGQSSVIVMTADQRRRLGRLRYEPGDHKDMCKRVYERVKMLDNKVLARVLSTDMARIREALARNEQGEWQDLFREILSANSAALARPAPVLMGPRRAK